MKTLKTLALMLGGFLLVSTISGCVNNDEYVRALREATANSSLTLVDAVSVAETQVLASTCIRGALLVNGDPMFWLDVVADGELNDIRVDKDTGEVMSVTYKGNYSGNLCEDSISLVDALTIAEEAGNGIAVAVVPDDDVACAREIQVLAPDDLWEVKVAGDGRVLEREISDEDGSGEDD